VTGHRFLRLLAPVVQLRQGESTTAALMFAYSFLAMTAYNIVKPITRSKFISDLGADNLPWVQLGAGLLIGVIMHAYARTIALVPRRWAIPATQGGLVVLLIVFWALFSAGYDAASVAFYVLGLILGILLISQFWTLANDIYDARHAKRLFGFIGGGASLGGATGAAITAAVVSRVGTVNLLLVGAAVMLACLVLVTLIVRREERAGQSGAAVEAEGVGRAEAIQLLRESRHLQLIAIIIGCAAMGGAIIDQQLNMAAESTLGQDADRITRFLAQVTVYLSLIGFLVQVTLTSQIHRLLGIGFALLILPVGLGTTAVVMLFNAALWAPAVARVLDTSLRYTVDKTTREVLFLPLPTAIKYRAKPFVDVTVDRFAKALGALLVLVLIKPWGFALSWQQLSYASLGLMGIWIVLAFKVKREYLSAFRRSIARHDVEVAEIRVPHADLQTIALLVEELAHPDERRVIYAIEILESLEKRHLVSPLLLHHSSAAVRARTLRSLETQKPEVAARWLPAVERLLADEDAAVRAGAVRAVAAIRGQEALSLMRQHLTDSDPRTTVTAAGALMDSPQADDVEAAESTLRRLAGDTRESAAPARLEVARALGDIPHPHLRHMLVPLMLDANLEVARAAIRSADRVGPLDVARGRPDTFLFVPPLVSLLRHRLLKNEARAVLVGYGEPVIEALAHFLQDQREDPWVRRHLPATMARIASQRTIDVLIDALADRDGFLRYKVIAALETLHRDHPRLVIRRDPIEALAMSESLRYFNALTLHANLTQGVAFGADTLLVRALEEKQRRMKERVFRLLGLIYPRSDISAAWFALEHGDARRRASASEYLDNVLSGALRRRVLLMIDDMPPDERVRRTNAMFRTRPRSPEDTLAQLIHDDDQVIAASAIHLAAERGVRPLAGDIEYALAHRDAHDWYAFESASWALASFHMTSDQRRARWLEPLPTVELADRLRQVTLFDYVSVDELFRFAGTARQVRYERGRALYPAGREPETLQFLIDGEVRFDEGATLTAPGPLAFEEMLEGRPLRGAVIAVEVAVTLSLTQGEFLTLLSDNIDIAHGLFKMLIDAHGDPGWKGVVHGRLPDAITRAARDTLLPMERVLLLQANPLFAGATSGQLVRLAAIAREVPLLPGTALVRESDDLAIYVVVRGALSVEAPGAATVAVRPGGAVGIYETLADVRAEAMVMVSDAGTALRIDGRDLFDLLADHVDLLQGMFSALLRSEGAEPVVESASLPHRPLTV
jgi:ATP/ADP translocase/HEAT repeat protein/CRP-like cAMP-binding protein